jgi:hypothetical protein
LKSESKEPEVKIQSLIILCPDRPDLVLPIPFVNKSKRSLFTLKEGSQYRLKFSFTVSNNIVSGLKYTNVVWKTGVRGRMQRLSLPFTIIYFFSLRRYPKLFESLTIPWLSN